ncbi:MAG: glycerophosphodiester phosphodiesterase [Pseudomonadales bacterium]
MIRHSIRLPAEIAHVSFVDPPVIIGHRGAAGLVPENTLPSFERAFALGVNAVELDVHVVEGRLIVLHDDTLDRTTNSVGPISHQSLTALRALDAGGGWPIPLLEEVLAALPPGTGINIELKGANTAEPVAELLTAFPETDVLVSSFDPAELARFTAASAATRVAPLFHDWDEAAWDIAETLNAWAINLWRKIATPPRLATARERGLRSFVYTVNNLETARRLFASGATGVFTDYPDRVSAAALQRG